MDTAQQFWSHTWKASGGCKSFGGMEIAGRYARVRWKGRSQAAHRVSLALHLGRPIPRDVLVLHGCDNTWCVNPDHLREGTTKDNTADMFARGRSRQQKEKARRATARRWLTEADAAAVLAKPASKRLRFAAQLADITYGEIASRIGVSRAHVAAAAQGRQQLSLIAKVRVGRVLRVAPVVIWPELELLALELLQGHGRSK